MPYFENAKEFRISGGRVTDLKRCTSGNLNDPSSNVSEIDDLTRSESSTGRMIVIGQGAATRVVVTPTTSASRSSSRAPSRAASPKGRREPSLNTQSLGQPPPRRSPAPYSRSPSSSWNLSQQSVPPLPDNPLVRSSQSQGLTSSTDMIGFSMPLSTSSSPPTFPVPSPSMPFAPAVTTTDNLSTSIPEIQRQPSPVSTPVFGPAEFPGSTPKSGNKISRSGTSSSSGKEEDKKKKVMKRFFEMWSKR
ncbi:hypothetical protein AGABI2DRAFT_189145 [Agaricus bisporus var. bisporus H97]|uniref:hypothetical protein n=1 Tax=Agaricus bisporus var. bisporus (strain H97 / ATCC MYA-4626 / FGSC 10389) TaxID=936046 RepID=UPI00029F79C8|nr:hypothetical protein AGABI2DRAFT_189145 [Agaricus bisporus var. bisporus H97]EKV50787.1 hypothetical protein AGABI2DRAFT_189145 [Agaricus bisporus var. bisporus H97]